MGQSVLRSSFVAAVGLLAAACLPTFEDSHLMMPPGGVPAFQEIPTPFTHVWEEPSHPFSGAAVIDVDGDGRHEVFLGGGRGQADMLLAFRDGKLTDIARAAGLGKGAVASHGAAATDIDNDGDVDLLVTRDDGLVAHVNHGGRFAARDIAIELPADSVALSVSVADIDQDGDADLYLSVFVAFPSFRSATFNDPTHAKKNILLRNDGGLKFTDITHQAGVAGLQNTFHATFANLDGDGDQDLILSQNTGEVEILENLGDGTFRNVWTKTGYGFWMGLAVGDMDRDGDLDIFASNAGTSIPKFLTAGDIRDDQRHNIDWIMMRNDGGLKFADVTQAMQLDGYGFAWGAQFEDLNNDGAQDLLVAQNYIKWPLHKLAPLPGKALLQLSAGNGAAPAFFQVPGLNLDNAEFGQSPVIMDIDADGRPDVLWLNMDGPLKAYLNKTTETFVTVRLPDAPAAAGALVRVTTDTGTVHERRLVTSTGLMTDPTPDLYFALPGAKGIARIEVTTLTGKRIERLAPPVNRVVAIDLDS